MAASSNTPYINVVLPQLLQQQQQQRRHKKTAIFAACVLERLPVRFWQLCTTPSNNYPSAVKPSHPAGHVMPVEVHQ
jgi:hypothetical protein